MYLMSRNCESNHSISLKFTEGHSTSHNNATLHQNIQQFLSVVYSQIVTVCISRPGKGGKLGDLSVAMSYSTFSCVYVYIVDEVSR